MECIYKDCMYSIDRQCTVGTEKVLKQSSNECNSA